jgi:signal transduction histidine kinase
MDMLITIIGTLAVVLIGLFVFTRDTRQILNQVYGLMTLGFVILIIANYFTTNQLSESLIYPIRIVLASTSIVIASLYFLIQLIRSGGSPVIHKPVNMIILALTIVVAILDISPLVFKGVTIEGSNIVPVPAFGAVLFILHLISLLAITLGSIVASMSKARGAKRSQYASILVGIVPVLMLAPLTSFVMPVLFQQTGLIFASPLYIIFFVFMVAYAMVKHGLFDIRLAAVRTATYVLSLITLSLVYYGLAYVLSSIIVISNISLSVGFSPINIALALLLAFIFQPVKRFFDRVTNRIFYKDNYSLDDFFARLNKTLGSTTDLRGLLERVADEVAQTIKSEQAFFLINTSGEHFMTVGTHAHGHLPKADAALFESVKTEYRVIVGERIASSNSVHRMMISHKIELALPLRHDDKNIGYLCIGYSLSSGYTKRDIKMLGTIADELVIAIQNALSVHEVKTLNETLQQRINEATSELRASNAQLHRLDEAKDEFVSMASHQLRTPLTSVKGYISMVLEGDAGKITSAQKHLLDEAFTSSERMVHLINDFLNVSRLQTGKFMIDLRPIDLAKVVGEELDSLASNASSRNLKFLYKIPKKFPILELDEGKMRQVIMNFADNAIYYSKEGTAIEVALVVEGNRCRFTVKDKGIGVPIAETAQLFTKFYRATNARRQRPDGTGVGLFLAKKVINAHGGDVIFESEEGKGSTFGFSLPIKPIKSR